MNVQMTLDVKLLNFNNLLAGFDEITYKHIEY